MPKNPLLPLIYASLASFNEDVPCKVCQLQVSKLKTHSDSPDLQTQLLFIKSFPFCVLKLTSLASILIPVFGSSIEQFSKYHCVTGDDVSVKSIFSLDQNPWHFPSSYSSLSLSTTTFLTTTGSSFCLLANV